MGYSEQEKKELNRQLKKWQDKQIKATRHIYFGNACEHMTDAEFSVWKIIAQAESYKDVNWLVWQEADWVIDKYFKMSRKEC